jgi:deoxyxylulose-5-phosphate synthase
MSNPREESVLGYSQKELDKIPNYILYIKVVEQLDQTFNDIKDEISIVLNTNTLEISNTLDNIKDAINSSDNGSYFSEISNTLDNLVTQTFELNKTMNNIAESLRVISHNNR